MFQAYRHVFVNRRKKDYYEMYLHHIVTIYLCCLFSVFLSL